MIDISVLKLNKSYGDNSVLKDVTFDINRGERVGLLGDNGSGKTTLFKIIMGELDYDCGEVHIANDARVGMIMQIPNYPREMTVEQVLKTSFSHLDDIAEKMRKLTSAMENGHDADALRRYGELETRFEHAGGYELDTRVHRVANGLGISAAMRAQYFRELSGGEKTRINLACAILQDTDVLLLDEPTNHLDIDAVEWLEGYLSRYSGTILIISHDRYFIDRTVTRVIELEDGETNFYAGNYSFYMEEKQARYLEQKKRYEAEQKKIAELSFAAERLHGWGMGNKRLQVRAFAMERRIERMRKTEKPRGNKKNLRAQFSSRDFGGDEVMLLHDVSKNFGERKLLQNISLKVENGDRIALIGKNGSGKTTLLNIIMGREEHEGAVRFGAAIKVGLLPQVVTFDNERRNLVDTVIYALNATPQTARNHLAAFDFTGEDVFETVDTLSGGERTRLALCILMARKINFLILDEPTNHLDIASREWIEEAVHSFEGTLLFVSHDRYFLDRFTNRVWSLDDAAIEDYLGGFTQYRNMVAAREAQKPVIRPASAQKSVKKKQVRRRDGERKIAECERDIAKLEDVISGITDEIELCSSDYERLEELYQKQHDTQEELDTMYLKWEALNEE